MERQDYETAISSYLLSLYYNRDTEQVVNLIKEVKGRIYKTYRPCDWTDQGDILYGMIVIMYGDYGTSPRSGWIDEENLQGVLEVLNRELYQYAVILESEIKFRKENEE